MRSNDTLLKKLDSVVQEIIKELAEGKAIDLRKELKERVIHELSELRCREWQERVVSERIRDIVRGELALGKRVVVLEARLCDHGLVGVGSGILNAIFEIGISWDYVLDLPLIPGSSVKGVFRRCVAGLCSELSSVKDKIECLESLIALTGWIEKPRESELYELSSLLDIQPRDVVEIAKRSYGAGLLHFHDTYLLCGESGKLLEPWIINPHYHRDVRTEYDVAPNPVIHLVLASDLRGVFIVAVEGKALDYLVKLSSILPRRVSSCSGRTCLAFLAQLLAATLSSGIGARTSRGFSRFRVEKVYLR